MSAVHEELRSDVLKTIALKVLPNLYEKEKLDFECMYQDFTDVLKQLERWIFAETERIHAFSTLSEILVDLHDGKKKEMIHNLQQNVNNCSSDTIKDIESFRNDLEYLKESIYSIQCLNEEILHMDCTLSDLVEKNYIKLRRYLEKSEDKNVFWTVLEKKDSELFSELSKIKEQSLDISKDMRIFSARKETLLQKVISDLFHTKQEIYHEWFHLTESDMPVMLKQWDTWPGTEIFTDCNSYLAVKENVTVEAILDSSIGCEYFCRFLEDEHSKENIDFCLAVGKYVTGYEEMSSLERLVKARKIAKTYITQNADRQINIDSELSDQIMKSVGISSSQEKENAESIKPEHSQHLNVDCRMFNSARKAVMDLMHWDSIPRFKESQHYFELQEVLTEPGVQKRRNLKDMELKKMQAQLASQSQRKSSGSRKMESTIRRFLMRKSASGGSGHGSTVSVPHMERANSEQSGSPPPKTRARANGMERINTSPLSFLSRKSPPALIDTTKNTRFGEIDITNSSHTGKDSANVIRSIQKSRSEIPIQILE